MIDFNDLLRVPNGWQPMSSAPDDGTPILIAQGHLVGIYAFIDEGRKNILGKPMGANWTGVHILSDLCRATKGGVPTGERVITMIGIDDDAVWMPLPETKFGEPQHTSQTRR